MSDASKVAGSYNTTNLAADVATAHKMTKAEALRVITTAFTLIGNGVARGEIVRVHSFGNFKPISTKERQGRNPKTGETTTIAASTRPHFTAAQNLKDKVRDKKEEAVDLSVPAAPPAGAPAVKPAAKPAVKQAAGAPVPKQPVRRAAAAPAATQASAEEIESQIIPDAQAPEIANIDEI